jgi:hypothetical protein
MRTSGARGARRILQARESVQGDTVNYKRT